MRAGEIPRYGNVRVLIYLPDGFETFSRERDGEESRVNRRAVGFSLARCMTRDRRYDIAASR